MRVTSVCHMFPNSARPHLGVFVKERLVPVARSIGLTMVAPVPAFPFIGRTAKYAGYEAIQREEICDDLRVLHPRYFMIPKYLKRLDASFYEFSLRPFMREVLERTQSKLLDVHWVYPDGIAALEWGRRFNNKVVVTVRGNEALHYYQNTPVRRLLVERMKTFDHVISVSHDLKEKLVNEYNVPAEKVTVIHNGVDKSKFAPGDRDPARRSLGFEEDWKYVLAISRLSSEKGIGHLLEAMRLLRNSRVRLVLVGSGPLAGEFNDFVTRHSLEDAVRFVPSVPHDQLRLWYNAADVLCLPSMWEGCPNVVIEALACGTPVVSSRVGAVPSFVGADCGVVVPRGDAAALAQALDHVLNRKWNPCAIAGSSVLRSWQEVAVEVVDVFTKVLNT